MVITDKEIYGVIFDFNGVLLFDDDIQTGIWNKIVLHFRKTKLTDYDKKSLIHGKTTRAIFESLLGEHLDDGEVLDMIKMKEEMYRKECLCRKSDNAFALSPGAEELLDYLAMRKIPCTIATSSSGEDLEFFVKELNLDKWFDVSKIIFNDGAFPEKPNPAIFLKAAKAIDISPESCFVFEDAISGIEAAIAANIGIIYGIGSAIDEKIMYKLSGVIATLAEFPRSVLN